MLGNTRRGVHSPRSRCPESVGAWSRCPRASSQEQSSAPGVYVGAVPADWAGAQNAANAQTPPGGPPSCREQLGALAAPAACPPLRAGPAAAPPPPPPLHSLCSPLIPEQLCYSASDHGSPATQNGLGSCVCHLLQSSLGLSFPVGEMEAVREPACSPVLRSNLGAVCQVPAQHTHSRSSR